MQARLAGDARVLEATGSVLHFLLTNDGRYSLTDEILARIHGMIGHLAYQLAAAHAEELEEPADIRACQYRIAQELVESHALLNHLHGLALEWQITTHLQQETGFNAELSPLLQALIGSTDEQRAADAVAMLAAQVRFIRQTARMELSLTELPGDLMHIALLCLRNCAADAAEDAAADRAEKILRANFDESRGRLGLAAKLVSSMGDGALAALSLDHAGVALFLSALGAMSGQPRLSVTMACSRQHHLRFALSLLAAGASHDKMAQQFALVHAGLKLPDGLGQIGPDKASALLSRVALAGVV